MTHAAANTFETENYFIRADYTARDEALTVESASGQYWTKERIKTASQFQYDVYSYARDLLAARPAGQRAFADIGCGYPFKTAHIVADIADSAMVVDQPTLQDIVARDFPALEFASMDLEQPAALDQKFDVVVCADVIEHLLSPDQCIENLKGLVKPDGYIVLSTPERAVLRGADCLSSPKPEHVREWTKDEFAAYLNAHGLDVVEHHLLPERRLNGFEKMLASVARKVQTHRRWEGCQMAVCRLK